MRPVEAPNGEAGPVAATAGRARFAPDPAAGGRGPSRDRERGRHVSSGLAMR